MYVCLCNALSDQQVLNAVQGGAQRPRDIHAACGCRPGCGRCAQTLLGIIRGNRAAHPATTLNQ